MKGAVRFAYNNFREAQPGATEPLMTANLREKPYQLGSVNTTAIILTATENRAKDIPIWIIEFGDEPISLLYR